MKASAASANLMGVHKKKKKFNKSNIELLLMVSIGIIFIFIFAYIPMFGVVLAFKQGDGVLSIIDAILYSPWVGFDNFVAFFNDIEFANIMRNTLCLNILQLLINFPAPIIFAILLSELPWQKVRKFVQSVTYFPYFLSWATFGGIILALISSDGIVNNILMALGLITKPLELTSAGYFWPLIIITSLLKGLGWGAIIYIAAIAGIDPQYYEAARMDGANRWHRIIHITIPSIAPTIILFFILSLSGILNNGFDHIYFFQNATNMETSVVLDTYIFEQGVELRMYSYTTAIGFFKSLVAIILLSLGNFIAKKTTGNGVI